MLERFDVFSNIGRRKGWSSTSNPVLIVLVSKDSCPEYRLYKTAIDSKNITE